MEEKQQETEDTTAVSTSADFEALQSVISALQPLSDETRRRILEAASTFLGIRTGSQNVLVNLSAPGGTQAATGGITRSPFSEDSTMSPKEFLIDKGPRTDVERVACLAYYLTHYRANPNFKTLDLSMLNTEAAQPKFANTADSASNAVKMGYIVPSTKGNRQISALGERFVRALPDRTAAKEVLLSMRRRTRTKRKRGIAEEAADE